MRISDWSSDVCSSDLLRPQTGWLPLAFALDWHRPPRHMNGTSYFYAHSDQWKYERLKVSDILSPLADEKQWTGSLIDFNVRAERMGWLPSSPQLESNPRSEEHTSELQSLMRISYAVFCLQKKTLSNSHTYSNY